MENHNRHNDNSSSQTIVLIMIFIAVIVFGIVIVKQKTEEKNQITPIVTNNPNSNNQGSSSISNSLSVNIPIYYVSDDGSILAQEWKTLSPGTHTVYRNSNMNKNDWIPTSDSYCRVTVYNDGSTDPGAVYFYYSKNISQPTMGNNNSAVIKDKLYLRTGPGKPPENSGIPNNSYETYRCPGDSITLVARAYNKSQAMWWFQLDGSIYEVDLRRTIDVSGYWTADKYLDDSSYDINSIPIVSGY